jgi:hypothetical protein
LTAARIRRNMIVGPGWVRLETLRHDVREAAGRA